MSSNRPTNESKHLGSIAREEEGTMKVEYANSIGSAILRLAKAYISNLEEKEIEQEVEACKEDLKKIAESKDTNEETAASIYFILKKIDEPEGQLDRLNLYLPDPSNPGNYTKIRHEFSLKIVLMLVWKAIHDDNKFSPSAMGEHEKDRKDRINIFFGSLKYIMNNDVCHQGHRNELLSVLNGCYENIKYIEDAKSAIWDYIKDKIHGAFWQTYDSTNDKNQLKKALMCWIKEQNAKVIVNLLEIEQEMRDGLEKMFIDNGICPNDIKLNDQINEAMSYLEFSCHLSRGNTLNLINEIFKFIPNGSQQVQNPNIVETLKSFQAWIDENYQFDETKSDVDTAITNFHLAYRAHEALVKEERILMLTGKMNRTQIDSTLQICNDFLNSPYKKRLFSATSLDLMETALKKVSDLTINFFKPEISSFFKIWDTAKVMGQTEDIKNLYAMLLDSNKNIKIIVSDADIKKLVEVSSITQTENKQQEATIWLTPYEINRVFLSAIIISPEKWTSAFANTVEIILNWLTNYLKTNPELNEDYYYPDNLLNQLHYLILEHKGQAELKNRPCASDRIVFPHQSQIKDIRDWNEICGLVDGRKRETLYSNFNTILFNLFVSQLKCEESFSVVQSAIFLDYLPKDKISQFLNKLVEKKCNLDRQDCMGDTILMMASSYNDVEVVKALIANRCNLNIYNKQKRTAFMYAINENCPEAVKMLIEAKCDIYPPKLKEDKDEDDDEDDEDDAYDDEKRMEALFLAASRGGYIEVVKELLQEGINVNVVYDGDNEDEVDSDELENTALMLAVRNQHLDVVKALLEREDIDLNAYDTNGNTALKLAVQNDDLEMVNLLIQALKERKCALEPDIKAASALMQAAGLGNLPVLNALIQAKCDVDHNNNNTKMTPLMVAVIDNDPEVVDTLLAASCNLDLKNHNGMTALEMIYAGGEIENKLKTYQLQKQKNISNSTQQLNQPKITDSFSKSHSNQESKSADKDNEKPSLMKQALSERINEITKTAQQNGRCSNQHSWATSAGILRALKEIFHDSVHIIDPDSSSIFNLFEANTCMQAARNYASAIGGHKSRDGVEYREGSILGIDQGKLAKPVVMILNTTSARPQDSKDSSAIGGNHWVTAVIMPAEGNQIEQLVFIDSMNPKRQIPNHLLDILARGNRHQYQSDTGSHCEEILPAFPGGLDVIAFTNNDRQQYNSYDCGWWAVYNAMCIVSRNYDAMKRPDKNFHFASALRETFPFLDKDTLPDPINVAETGSTSLMQKLIQAKCNLNFQRPVDGRTPLMVAAANGDEHMTHELMQAGCRLDVRDKDGNTALTLVEKRLRQLKNESECEFENQWNATLSNKDFCVGSLGIFGCSNTKELNRWQSLLNQMQEFKP